MPAEPPPVSERPPDPEVIVKALAAIVRKGLPVTPTTADDRLLALRGVWARSIDPDDRYYRVQGLDRLLRELLPEYPDEDLVSAAQVLFGMAPGSRGTTLTQRFKRIAKEQNYSEDHVRQDVQKKIVQQVAWMIHVDSQTYTPRARGVPPPLAVSGDTPQIAPEDLQSRERLEHEEALSRLWALVYALRAELLEVERHRRYPAPEGAAELLDAARQRRDRLVASLGQSIEDYVERWGERIAHGEAEFEARSLTRLAGWGR